MLFVVYCLCQGLQYKVSESLKRRTKIERFTNYLGSGNLGLVQAMLPS